MCMHTCALRAAPGRGCAGRYTVVEFRVREFIRAYNSKPTKLALYKTYKPYISLVRGIDTGREKFAKKRGE